MNKPVNEYRKNIIEAMLIGDTDEIQRIRDEQGTRYRGTFIMTERLENQMVKASLFGFGPPYTRILTRDEYNKFMLRYDFIDMDLTNYVYRTKIDIEFWDEIPESEASNQHLTELIRVKSPDYARE